MAKSELPKLKPAFLKFVRHLFKRQVSNFYLIQGRRGSGKTNFALLLIEALFEIGLIKHFATNVKIYESPFHIEAISNLPSLKSWCTETRGPKLYLFDEIAKSFKRRTPMSKLNVELISYFQILRKYKLSIIASTIDEKFMDRGILGPETLDGYFEKPSFRNQKIGIYYDLLERLDPQELFDIPLTKIRFDTWDSAPFTKEGPIERPILPDEDTAKIWDWAHGATNRQVGWHPQELNRKVRKILKTLMEKEYSHLTKP